MKLYQSINEAIAQPPVLHHNTLIPLVITRIVLYMFLLSGAPSHLLRPQQDGEVRAL